MEGGAGGALGGARREAGKVFFGGFWLWKGYPPMADPRFQDFRANDQRVPGRFLGEPPHR